ncbi:MAG TPA: glycosyltransferase, partial [Stenomitos sp.]
MRILVCNAFYYPRGGAEVCALDLEALLASKGHEVISFSMEHPRNLPSPYSSYFGSYIDYPELLKNVNPETIFKATERIIFSRETRDKLTQLIKDTKPDLAHVHNVGHELSPSALYAIASANIPIVRTVHDFGLLCPNSSFLSHGELCERCKGAHYYQAILRRCKRNSLPASTLAAMGAYTHDLLKSHQTKVDVFLAPSSFLRQKLIDFGYPGDKIVHLPNAIKVAGFEPSFTAGNYALYFGRLSYEKGLYTLLKAMTYIPNIPLIIAGEGPLGDELREYAQKAGLTNVQFVGYQTGKHLHHLIRNAAFTIMASECYENAPLACIESMALGRSVVGSNIGGIPEL